MSWEFRVGQKVVCVDDGQNRIKHPLCAPDPEWALRSGEIYILRWVGEYQATYEVAPSLSVRLDGIDRSHTFGGRDTPFLASRFRPLITDTQSWLREILEKPPEKQKVGV